MIEIELKHVVGFIQSLILNLNIFSIFNNILFRKGNKKVLFSKSYSTTVGKVYDLAERTDKDDIDALIQCICL